MNYADLHCRHVTGSDDSEGDTSQSAGTPLLVGKGRGGGTMDLATNKYFTGIIRENNDKSGAIVYEQEGMEGGKLYERIEL